MKRGRPGRWNRNRRYAIYELATGWIAGVTQAVYPVAPPVPDGHGGVWCGPEVGLQTHWFDAGPARFRAREDWTPQAPVPARIDPGAACVLLSGLPKDAWVRIKTRPATRRMAFQEVLTRPEAGVVRFSSDEIGEYQIELVGKYRGGPWAFDVMPEIDAVRAAREAEYARIDPLRGEALVEKTAGDPVKWDAYLQLRAEIKARHPKPEDK